MKIKVPFFIAGIILGLVCVALIAVALYVFQPATRNYQYVTPVIKVIPAPTLEPSPTYGPSLEPTATPPEGIPPDPGANISVGISIHISGTGGEGLRLRREAGKNGTPIFLGAENEVFTVVDGPKSADGYTWWYLQAPADTTRAGWAASNYLAPQE